MKYARHFKANLPHGRIEFSVRLFQTFISCALEMIEFDVYAVDRFFDYCSCQESHRPTLLVQVSQQYGFPF